MRFEVLQQGKMVRHGEKDAPGTYYESSIKRVGFIGAPDVKAAFFLAREMKEFRYASGLARFPILGNDETLAEAQNAELALQGTGN